MVIDILHLRISIMYLVRPPPPQKIVQAEHCLQFLPGRPQYPGEIKDKGYVKL